MTRNNNDRGRKVEPNEKATVEMTSNGAELTLKTPGRGGICKVALTPHPTRKGKALVQHWDFPWRAQAWLASCNATPPQWVIPMGEPWEKSYKANKSEHKIIFERYREREEWRKKCKATNYTAKLPMGTYVVIDPCYLPKRPAAEEKIGTAFEVERLAGGGYQWRMFGDGPGVDSGTLCILPAAQCEEAFDDGRLSKLAYKVLRCVTSIEWTCARQKDKKLWRVHARRASGWKKRLEIHVRSGGWHCQPDDVVILPNDRSITEW